MTLDEVADHLDDITEYTVKDSDGMPVCVLTETFVLMLADRLRQGEVIGQIH